MDIHVYPCDSCTHSPTFSCMRCAAWRKWYCYRQSLINAYAAQLARCWRYELPLHRVRKEP